MTQLTLTPAAKAAIAHGSALAKVRRNAYLELARLILANPDRYPELKPLAQKVLKPALPTEKGAA